MDLEINIQLGELTVKKNTLEVLDAHFGALPDFVSVLGQGTLHVQCAEVSNTTHRSWLRVVGKRHDLQVRCLRKAFFASVSSSTSALVDATCDLFAVASGWCLSS